MNTDLPNSADPASAMAGTCCSRGAGPEERGAGMTKWISISIVVVLAAIFRFLPRVLAQLKKQFELHASC